MAIAKLEKQQVIGALKATGSYDADVLFARKEELLQDTRKMKLLGVVPIVLGSIMTVTIVGAVVGVPALGFGIFMRKRIKHNLNTAEEAYAEYMASLGATPRATA